MTEDKKRLLITTGRRVVFAGLSLLGVWLIISILKLPWVLINATKILFSEDRYILWEYPDLSPWVDLYNNSDWANAWLSGKPVSEMIGQRLGPTIQLIGVGALLSLAIAIIFLLMIYIVNRIVKNKKKGYRVWRVLRTVIISSGVSTPIFWIITCIVAYLKVYKGIEMVREYEGSICWWPVFFISLLPAWLLVQACYGELEKHDKSYGLMIRNMFIKLVVTLLKMVGAIIALVVIVEYVFEIPGLGQLLLPVTTQRDFPVLFGIAWIFVIIVIISKLSAELIEIFYKYFTHQTVLSGLSNERINIRNRIPKGWLIFCLVLVFISIVFAVIAPVFAPYPEGEIHIEDRLGLPSGEYKLGTDQMGRDILSQLIYAVRTDVQIGFMCMGIFLVIIIGWSILAVRFKETGDWINDTKHDLVMLPKDILCAFPWLVLILVFVSMYGNNNFPLMIIIGLVLLPRAVSMMKEAYSSLFEERGWIDSVIRSVPVMIIFTVAGAIIYISSASFLGFGVPPGTVELGDMLSLRYWRFMEFVPRLFLWPGIFLTLLIFVWVLAGNTLLEYLGFKSRSVWLNVFE